ncbi:MAG TPA: hypothetical protein VEL51_17905 [Vicinamibacterales bacterium]|nr:hypothetical protein [Vicinamibacterales bacterium]
MADKWNREEDDMTGAGDEEIRGVASDEEEDEFDDTDDLDEEEDEESTTF